MAAENWEAGFYEGKLWSALDVLDETCDTEGHVKQRLYDRYHHPQQVHPRRKSPAESIPQNSRSIWRPHHRSKPEPNWPSGGPGMQAFFLDSGRRSCGTGVFLPQRTGVTPKPSKKPACSPVLLPSRVVQALNLNVCALELQISPQQAAETITNPKGRDCISNREKKGNDLAAQCFGNVSQNKSCTEDVFLPKEWTY